MKNLLGLFLMLFAIPSSADIVPIPGSQRIRPIFDSSDLVIAGTIDSVAISTEQLSTNGAPGWVKQHSRAVVEIRDTYKQDSPTPRRIAVIIDADVPSASSEYSIFRKGDTFLLFLKALPAGDYALADRFLGATHFAFIPLRPGHAGLDKLQDTLTMTALRDDVQDSLRALQLLSGFDSIGSENLASIGRITLSKDPDLALSAFAALLTSRNADILRSFSAYLSRYKGNAEPFALSNIAGKLADLRDKESLLSIENLAESQYVSIRTGAIRSLRARKDIDSVGALVRRLDDGDATIKYLAVITLAETLNKYDGDYAPSMYLFDTRPEYYISLWKRWWEEEGKLRYGPKADFTTSPPPPAAAPMSPAAASTRMSSFHTPCTALLGKPCNVVLKGWTATATPSASGQALGPAQTLP